jgi:hypothetical protein
VSKLSREAYERLVAENIAVLRRCMADTLERRHIESILRDSADLYYSPFCGQCGGVRHDYARCDGAPLARP